MIINNEVVKVLEQYELQSEMPDDLKSYLFNRYSSEPLPYEQSEQDLYSNIKKDINAYKEGNLDLTIKTPEQLLKDDLNFALEAYGDAMFENRRQHERICLLQDFIQHHKLNELFKSYEKNPMPVTGHEDLPYEET